MMDPYGIGRGRVMDYLHEIELHSIERSFEYEKGEIRTTGAGLSRFLNYQNQKFGTLSCKGCGLQNYIDSMQVEKWEVCSIY